MTPGPGIEPGTHWWKASGRRAEGEWKASALTTAPTLREIINLTRGFRFFRVFVAVIQTELKGSED